MVPFIINIVQIVTQQPQSSNRQWLVHVMVASLCFQESGLLSQPQRSNENQCKPVIWFEGISWWSAWGDKKGGFLRSFSSQNKTFQSIGREVLLTFAFSIHSCVEQELFWLDVSMPKTTWPSDTGACSLLALSEKEPWWRWQVAYRCFHENRSYCTKEKG